MEVQVEVEEIKQMEVDDVEVKGDKDRSTLKISCKRFLSASQMEQQIPVVHQCSSWEIQVRECFLNVLFSCLTHFISGDYAWGREGLDTIVTQLLNQMDNAGKFNVQ